MAAKDQWLIYAYGFDAAGFTVPAEPVEGPEFKVQWVNYRDKVSLDTADGLIIVQGIFERIRYRDVPYSGRSADVQFDEPLLLERERQVINLFQRGGWACFLVRDIVDHVPAGSRQREIKATDLCKRVLNMLPVYRQCADGIPWVRAVRDEFRAYIEKYGVAKVVFTPRAGDRVMKVLARAGDAAVGVAIGEKTYFLPFHTTRTDAATAKDLVTLVASSVLAYRQKVIVELPDWVHSLRFDAETRLLEERARLQERLATVDTTIDTWRNYKAILVTSGDLLKRRLIEILEQYFGLQVDSLDEGREDFKILFDGTVIALGEAKGTNSGVKREYVNQVDSHRERNALPGEVPGVLIINNEMDVAGVEKRVETAVPQEQIAHASRLNVLIVRTIDLLYLMKHLEGDENRGAVLLEILKRGGGWLRAKEDGWVVVTG